MDVVVHIFSGPLSSSFPQLRQIQCLELHDGNARVLNWLVDIYDGQYRRIFLQIAAQASPH